VDPKLGYNNIHDVDEGIILRMCYVAEEILLLLMMWTNGTTSMQLLACEIGFAKEVNHCKN
jgi:hypothetical protein